VFVVDTNWLLYAVNGSSEHHDRARNALNEWLQSGRALRLTWGIVYEFLRVATHRAVFPRPLRFREAWEFLASLLEHPNTRIIVEGEEHRSQLEATIKELPQLAGSRFHDLHIALLMREHGVPEIRTADADFHRFPWVKVHDPRRGKGST
jgi:toxin-antitoxin system PIN domain toxin